MRNSRLPAVLKPSLIAFLVILLPAGSQAAGLDTAIEKMMAELVDLVDADEGSIQV